MAAKPIEVVSADVKKQMRGLQKFCFWETVITNKNRKSAIETNFGYLNFFYALF
jgi:hypothetical protein